MKFLAHLVTAIAVAGVLPAALGAQNAPTPRPFPGSGPSGGSSGTPTSRPTNPPPSSPAPVEPVRSQPLPGTTAPAADSATANIGDVPMYPGAEFLDSYDAGKGQRYVLYGASASYETIVAFYRQTLKNGGRDLLPGMRQFELADFKSDRMAYPPSVVVRDYSTSTPTGYLFVKGSTEKRYQTVIQVVPPPPALAR